MGRKTPDSPPPPSYNGGSSDKYYENNNHKETSSRYRSRSRERRYEQLDSYNRSPYPEKRRPKRSRSAESRSPDHRRRRTDNPPPSKCLGVFGMNIHTRESHVRDIFSKFGPIRRITMIYCAHTGRSRGFCFVYYDRMEDAMAAKEHCNGLEIDERRIRVDFSITERAHSPTPGMYMGRPSQRSRYRGGGDDHKRRRENSGHRYKRQRSFSRSPSYEKVSRRKRRYNSRSRSRSYSPEARSRVY